MPLENSGVWSHVLPLDVSNLLKTTNSELVELCDVEMVWCSRLKVVRQGCEYNSLVSRNLRCKLNFMIISQALREHVKGNIGLR